MDEILYNYAIIALLLVYLSNSIRSVMGNTVLFMFSLFMSIEILSNIQDAPLTLTMLLFIYIAIGYINIERRKQPSDE